MGPTYRAVGGVHGAVARAADKVVDSLSPGGRKAARDLFLRLVIPTETSDPIRQRVPRAELAVDATTVEVLDALVTSRLVIADRDTVEVAHEAVCRAWPRKRSACLYRPGSHHRPTHRRATERRPAGTAERAMDALWLWDAAERMCYRAWRDGPFPGARRL
jgi:hypothetical protein